MLKGYWYVYLIVVIGIVVGVKLYMVIQRMEGITFDKLKLKIPVFGLLQTKSACSFARTMSTLLQAGMPMIDAIEISAFLL